MDAIFRKKIIVSILIGVVCSVFMFGAGFFCQNVISKIDYLQNELSETNLLQKNMEEFYYTYSLSPVDLKNELWGENRSKEPHIFFVVSDLNCSLCLDKFMKELVALQDSINIHRSSLLLLNTSGEILHRYKRIYKIKIPIYAATIERLDTIMNHWNAPYAFISDQNNCIMHLYSSKDVLSFKRYLELMKQHYSDK